MCDSSGQGMVFVVNNITITNGDVSSKGKVYKKHKIHKLRTQFASISNPMDIITNVSLWNKLKKEVHMLLLQICTR